MVYAVEPKENHTHTQRHFFPLVVKVESQMTMWLRLLSLPRPRLIWQDRNLKGRKSPQYTSIWGRSCQLIKNFWKKSRKIENRWRWWLVKETKKSLQPSSEGICWVYCGSSEQQGEKDDSWRLFLGGIGNQWGPGWLSSEDTTGGLLVNPCRIANEDMGLRVPTSLGWKY